MQREAVVGNPGGRYRWHKGIRKHNGRLGDLCEKTTSVLVELMDRWDNSTEKRGLQGKDHRSKCQKGQRMLWVALLHLLPDAWTVDHQRIKKLRHGQEVIDSSSFSNANATKNMKWGGLLFEVFCQVRLFVFGLLAKNYTKKLDIFWNDFFLHLFAPPIKDQVIAAFTNRLHVSYDRCFSVFVFSLLPALPDLDPSRQMDDGTEQHSAETFCLY